MPHVRRTIVSSIFDARQAVVFPLNSCAGEESGERHVSIGTVGRDNLRTLHNKHRGALVEGTVRKHVGYGI